MNCDRTRDLLVEVAALRKTFDGANMVLDGIDLEVADGDFISLIGPSGCGKSTLLKLVAGLIEPSTGAIEFARREPALQEKLSYVFQEPTLMPWQTVLQNVELPMKLAGVARV